MRDLFIFIYIPHRFTTTGNKQQAKAWEHCPILAQRKKLMGFSLSLVIVFTAVFNLNRSHVFSLSHSLMSFWRPKGRKGPARGKSSRPLLCSGIAKGNILQSKSPCHLNLSVDFWVMRTFLS